MKAIDVSQKASGYATFPRRFASYRWFKPVLVALLTGVFTLVFQIALILVATIWSGDANFIDSFGDSYETMNVFTGAGALAELGSIGVILPALALATVIVRDRPFSSYTSSRGGWNWSAFAKCLGVAAALMAAITVVQIALFPDDIGTPVIRFTVGGFIVCMAMVPIQCLAEEYLFRGFILQTIGSWTKLPVIAVLVSAALFAAGHPYNDIGVIAIFVNGVVWGALTLKTRGIEASSAMHIVNNLMSFGFCGFGLAEMTSEVDMVSLGIDVFTCVTFAVLVILADRKFGWFDSRDDGVDAYNERVHAKAQRKRRHHDAPPERPLGPTAVAN